MAKPKRPQSDRALLDTFWREPVERTVLANGLTLLVKQDRSAALASVQVWVRTGSIHEGGQLGAGLSHYLEHMLFKGTSRRNVREISATVQAHGGYINAYTTFDRTVYYIDLPSEHLEVAVDVLADAVLHSTLPSDEVEREKNVILREIAMTKDDPDGRLWETLFSTAFREHPYRQPVIGHKDVFEAAGRDALVAYYRERYVPNNMVVVIAGDVAPSEALAIVERHFGPAHRSRLAPVLVPSEPLQLGPRRVQRYEKVEVVRAALAWAIPGLTDPSAPVLDLLAMVLGSGDSSVLWQEVREKKMLVHSIDASSWKPGSSGLFCVTFTCDGDKRQAAEAAIMRVLSAHAAPGAFKAAQVRKAYRQSVVSEINTCKTMSGQASRLGMAEVVVGELDFSRTYFERLATGGPARPRAGPEGVPRAGAPRLGLARAGVRGGGHGQGEGGLARGPPRLRGDPPRERRPDPLSARPAPAQPEYPASDPRGADERGRGPEGKLRAPRDAPHEGRRQAERGRGRPQDRGGRRPLRVLLRRQHDRVFRRGAAA